ncbi:MAG: glutaredoxin 3 [Steroidobacteraceae bacterium]
MDTGKPPVLMYARSGCGYCSRARQLLGGKGVAYTEIDVETVGGARQEMQRRSGRNTVPQIFVGDRHLGGFDDLKRLDASGELDPILAAGSVA